VRTLLILLAGLALVPSALASGGAHETLSLSASAVRALYGDRVTLSGRITGRPVAGRAITIEAWPYGASAPNRLAVVHTDASGEWTLKVGPKIETAYQAGTPAATSPHLVIGVAPVIAVHSLGLGRVGVEVVAARHFAGRAIEIQRRTPAGTWETVGHARLNPTSMAVLTPPGPAGTMRIAMSVNEAGAGYLGAASDAFAYRPTVLELKPESFKVEYGSRVALAGRLVNGPSGEDVEILAWQYGHSAPKKIGTLTTGQDGRFTLSVRPLILTTYEARLGDAFKSPRVPIDVRPLASVRELGGGAVAVHVLAAKSLRGRQVQLQRLVRGHGWVTIAKEPLNAGSTAVFTLPLAPMAVRVAMSVNQAGAGYLGTTSHLLVYRPA
jgi:hypothetical protein